MPVHFEQLAEYERLAKSFALCTIIECGGSTPRHVGSKMVVFPDGSIEGSIGGGETEEQVRIFALDALSNDENMIINLKLMSSADDSTEGGWINVFVEPILPKHQIVIFGCGHVGKALSQVAKWLGFRITISDDRVDLCNKTTNPHCDEYVIAPISEAVSQIRFTPSTYVVLATRSLDLDIVALPLLMKSPHSYIGVLGSKKRWAITRQALINTGIDENIINTIHAPIGLDIHAETPEEIAVSIICEIIKIKSIAE